jgi:hypothetical protein
MRSTYGANGDEMPLDLTITMHRHGCEKRCPVYKVIIFGDGTSIVVGEHYVKTPVLDKVALTSADVGRLVDAFKSADYFHLEDIYGYRGKGCASTAPVDEQVVVTTIVMNGNGHSITHHRGCGGAVSERLTSLENTIDQVARTARRLNLSPAAKK